MLHPGGATRHLSHPTYPNLHHRVFIENSLWQDTLWLMEMTEEYERAAEWAREELGPFDKCDPPPPPRQSALPYLLRVPAVPCSLTRSYSRQAYARNPQPHLHTRKRHKRTRRPYEASVFETTIRVVGGLLSAYDLTGDEGLAQRCMQLTDRLLYAFDTETGIPMNTLGLDTLVASNPAWTKGASTLSEYGTEQLEFVRLSAVSGDPLYAEKAERSIQLLHEKHPGKARSSKPSTRCCTKRGTLGG